MIRNGRRFLNLKFVRSKSAQASSKPILEDDNLNHLQEDSEKIMKTEDEKINISIQSSNKLPKRDPLIKNFFLGIADKELLAHPEVIPRDDMQKLTEEQLPIQNFFSQINEKIYDATRLIPKDVISNLKELGLFGLNVSQNFGGKDWQLSASLMASESEKSSPNIALSLLSHRSIVDVLNNAATEQQKQRYMEKLASGSTIATEAIYENNNSDIDLFKTKAEYIPEQDIWLLNGEKIFVINGTIAGLFLVVAQTKSGNSQNGGYPGITIFLVDSSKEGVKIGNRHISLGLRGVESTSVQFNNVKLTSDCIIGEANQGTKIGEMILQFSRLRSSQIAFSIARDCISQLASYAVDNQNCGVPLMDMDLIKNHASKSVCATYAMESMIYFTAGISDEFDGQDISLESAITKYYSYTRLFDIATKSLKFIGSKSLVSGENTEMTFRNATQLFATGEPIDTLKIFIALAGLQHAGSNLVNTVMKNRNPLFHPMHIFKKFFELDNIDRPKSKMQLNEHLHPSLAAGAQCLEYNILRMKMCVELLLSRHGIEIISKHSDAYRLTEIAAITYSMFTSLSRASRSYCIGLPLADHEMLLATSICCHGNETVKTLTNEIFNGEYVNNDINLKRLSKQIFQSREYFPTHPLKYNF